MEVSLNSLSADQLRRAADLLEEIENLKQQLYTTLGEIGTAPTAPIAPPPRGRPPGQGGMSAAGRARIAEAQRRRWALHRSQQGASPPRTGAPKRTMSPEQRARISAIARLRWKRAKAAGRTRL